MFQYSIQYVVNSFIFTVRENASIVDCLNSGTCRISACFISSETRSIMFFAFFDLLLHCHAESTELHSALAVHNSMLHGASSSLSSVSSSESCIKFEAPDPSDPLGSLTQPLE